MVTLDDLFCYFPLDGDFKNAVNTNESASYGGVAHPIHFERGIKNLAFKAYGDNYFTYKKSPTAQYTISLWIKPDEFTGVVFQIYLGNSLDIKAYFSNNTFGIRYKHDYYNDHFMYYNKIYKTNKWYHIVLVVNNSDLALYINTDKIFQSDGRYYNNDTRGRTFEFAKGGFKGLIDEIKFINRPISDDDVKYLYYEPFTNKSYFFNYFLDKPNIKYTLMGDKRNKFIYDSIYTDFLYDEIETDSFIIDTKGYKYSDIYIMGEIEYIKKNGIQIIDYIRGLKVLQKEVDKTKIEVSGNIKKILCVHHNGYWSDLENS